MKEIGDVHDFCGNSVVKPSQQEYLRLNGKYMAEAEELLAKKDYSQASEELWGAPVEVVKAVAAKRGTQLGTHRSIADYVSKLAKDKPIGN